MKDITVLIVDDVVINRTLLANIFENEYDVLQAENGKTALAILESGVNVNLILLDLMMPVMDGMTFIKHVKGDKRYAKIPVIVATQKGEADTEIKALELGADDFVTKPYNPKALRCRVGNLIEKYILEKRQIELLLQRTADKLEALTETVPGGIGIFEVAEGGELRCNYYNEGLHEMLGYTRQELERIPDAWNMNFIVKEDRTRLRQEIGQAIEARSMLRITLRMLKKSGEVIWVSVSAKPLTKAGACPIFHAVFMDVTEEKNNEMEMKETVKELQFRIEHDVLTGIYNRETFYERTRTFIQRNATQQCIIAVWNIDRFKVVNELFGSEKGDAVLKSLAEGFRTRLEGIGTYGRLEADHFATCTTREAFERSKGEVEDILVRGVQGDIVDYPVMLHVGLYKVVDAELSIDIMCDRASLALQSVKTNAMVRMAMYDASMSSALFDEQNLVNEMREALKTRQFYVQLQPITDAVTGKVVSAEALVRWKHPVKGMIPPSVFIPLFERNGFITRLDVYVWEEVCTILEENQKQGIPNVPISVNVSRINFYRKNLLGLLLEMVKRHHITPGLLKLEITESAYTDNPTQLLRVMTHFQEKGFQVLMDDFGSGYSSLNMLKNVSVDVLKIDMKFMDNLETTGRSADIIQSIIDMAKRLHMQTVAEGVETRSQFELLRGMGCDAIQGYYFSKPLMVGEFRDYVINDTSAQFLRVQRERNEPWVLVADDVELIRVSVMSILESDYKVVQAKNGREAYELLEQYSDRIRMVLTDIQMPLMDGFELLDAIRHNSRIKHIPCMVITASEEADSAITALSKGAVDVIVKPFEADILVARVHNIIAMNDSKVLQREVCSLRDDNFARQSTRKIIESGFHALCRMKIFDDRTRCEILYANREYYELHGLLENEDAPVRTAEELGACICDADRQQLWERLWAAVDKQEGFFQNEICYTMKNGVKRRMLSTCAMSYAEGDVFLEILEVQLNSGVKQVVETYSGEETASSVWRGSEYKEILKGDACLFAEINLSGNKVSDFCWNQRQCIDEQAMLPYDVLIERFVSEYVHPDENSYARGMLNRQQLLKWYTGGKKESKIDIRIRNEAGVYEWYSSVIYFMRMEEGRQACAIWQVKNVHSEKMRLSQITKLAEQDALTGLYNRSVFQKRVEEACARCAAKGKTSAFFMVDLDNFKAINDSFGHDFGDNILKTVAAQIRASFRKTDSVGRMGGDEFAIFTPCLDERDAAIKKAAELCRRVHITFDNGGSEVSIGCSIGVAFTPEAGHDFEALYVHADEALYQAKNTGKNRYVIYERREIQ